MSLDDPEPPPEPTLNEAFDPTAIDELEEISPDYKGGFSALVCLLAVASVVGTLAILPFSAALLVQMKEPRIPEDKLPFVLGVSAVVEFVISGVAILLGLLLARRAGLGAPDLTAALTGDRKARRRIWSSLPLATAIGLALGGVLVFYSMLHPTLAKSDQPIVMPPIWEGFLASIGAGIREEIWLRFGLMTLLAWFGAVLLRQERASPEVVWTANFLAAIAFAAIHLPQTAGLIGLSAPVVIFVFLGNGLPGMAFGWLYWRRGLVSAMVAHFWLDIVLKVILPALVT